jgi:hypothetical protein
MRDLDRHLAECRRLGLTIDEDFERGPRKIRWRYGLAIIMLAALSLLAVPHRHASSAPPPTSERRPAISNGIRHVAHSRSKRVSV